MRRDRIILAIFLGLAIPAITALVMGGCSESHSSSAGDSGSEASMGADAAAALSQLEQATGVKWVAVIDPRFGTPQVLFPQAEPTVALTAGANPSSVALRDEVTQEDRAKDQHGRDSNYFEFYDSGLVAIEQVLAERLETGRSAG